MTDGINPPEKSPAPTLDMSADDRIVLEEIARLQIAGTRGMVTYDDLCASKALSAIPEHVWLDAVQRLDRNRLVKMRHAFGVPFSCVTLTEFGSRKLADD